MRTSRPLHRIRPNPSPKKPCFKVICFFWHDRLIVVKREKTLREQQQKIDALGIEDFLAYYPQHAMIKIISDLRGTGFDRSPWRIHNQYKVEFSLYLCH